MVDYSMVMYPLTPEGELIRCASQWCDFLSEAYCKVSSEMECLRGRPGTRTKDRWRSEVGTNIRPTRPACELLVHELHDEEELNQQSPRHGFLSHLDS